MIEVKHDTTRFSRVGHIKMVNKDLFENNYKKRSEKGHQDEFAKLGWERLGGTQGKEFRK